MSRPSGSSKQLEEKVSTLETDNRVLEKERQYYFDKLQMVETVILANQMENQGLGKAIIEILYAGEKDAVDILDGGQVTVKAADGSVKTIAVN